MTDKVSSKTLSDLVAPQEETVTSNPIGYEDIPPFNPDIAMENYKKESSLSYKKYLADNIRRDYPEIIKSKLDDDKAIEFARRYEAPDKSPEVFQKILDDMYKSKWTPPKAPSWLEKNTAGLLGNIGNLGYQTLQDITALPKAAEEGAQAIQKVAQAGVEHIVSGGNNHSLVRKI